MMQKDMDVRSETHPMTSSCGTAEPGNLMPIEAPGELSSAENQTPRIRNTQTTTC